MDTKRISALALKACLVVVLGASANGCVLLVPESGAKGGAGEVTICHKGKKTMTLPRNAAASHMEHGDRYGAC